MILNRRHNSWEVCTGLYMLPLSGVWIHYPHCPDAIKHQPVQNLREVIHLGHFLSVTAMLADSINSEMLPYFSFFVNVRYMSSSVRLSSVVCL